LSTQKSSNNNLNSNQQQQQKLQQATITTNTIPSKSKNNYLIIPRDTESIVTSGGGGSTFLSTGSSLKIRKSSLQMAHEKPAGTHGDGHSVAGAAGLQQSHTFVVQPQQHQQQQPPNVTQALSTTQSNSNNSVNWQNYFNSKLNKEKLSVSFAAVAAFIFFKWSFRLMRSNY
jgi:hypothetical protein